LKTTPNGKDLYNLIEKLFPINRSITGDGVRETLSIISGIIPLEITEIPSGTKVLDWEIPFEWNIKDAWIKNSRGETIVDFQQSNLHVLNYSIPVNKQLNLSDLKEHLFTNPEMPDHIPYRTSYHNPNWGFCLPHNQFTNLADETYEVFIDSTLAPGSLTYGEYLIKGTTDEEVLISTHICHPSLANDNLSGIAVATFLAKQLMQSKAKYSYRFLFVPSTIGSIAWLSRNEKTVQNIKHGLVLTLLGDSSMFYYKKTRRARTEIDRIVIKVLNDLEKKHKVIDFYPYGYDERQYCSPSFNLPVGRLSRKPHGEFPEYHTSADNLDFVKPEKLEESLELISTVLEEIERQEVYLNLYPKGEPMLGKRGLFKVIGGDAQSKDLQMAILWMLNMSDGDHSMCFISELSGIDMETIQRAKELLLGVELLKKLI